MFMCIITLNLHSGAVVMVTAGYTRKVQNIVPNYIKLCATSIVLESPETRVEIAEYLLQMCLQAGNYVAGV